MSHDGFMLGLTRARHFTQNPVFRALQNSRCTLDLGADDYLTKPFALAEFMARLR
jgi:hypothetical protein